MFGEYAQVASYINQNEMQSSQYEDDMYYLPSYLLPVLNTNGNYGFSDKMEYPYDFIIIAEFSEIEGPKPLMTIPSEGGKDFDKNGFVVKIMAVDHQTGTSGFTLTEDTQVIVTDSGDFNVAAFVHHFVLYDNTARGFVRPFCMAYVTKDERKLIKFYDEFSVQFHKVSRLFKYGNKMVFVKDLDQQVKDLEYTKCAVVAKTESVDDEEEIKYKDLRQIQILLEEIQEICNVIKPLLNDKKLEARFYTLESRAWQELNTPKRSIDTISLQEQRLSDNSPGLEKYGSVSDHDSSLSLFHKPKNYKPKIIEIKRKKKYDRVLRGLHELCSWGTKEGMKKLRCIFEHFKRETMILELEKEENLLLEPSSCSLTVGQCVTHNFLSGVSLRMADCSYAIPTSQPVGTTQKWSSLDTLDGSVDSFKSVISEVSLNSFNSNDNFLTSSPPKFDKYEDDDDDEELNNLLLERADSNISMESDTTPSVYESFPNSPVKTATTFKSSISKDSFSSQHECDNDNTNDILQSNDQTENTTTVEKSQYSASEDYFNKDSYIIETTTNNEVSKTNNVQSTVPVNVSDKVNVDSAVGNQVEPFNSTSYNQTDGSINVGSVTGRLQVLEPPPTLCRQFSEPDTNTDTTQSSNENKGSNAVVRKPKCGSYTIGDLICNLKQGSPGNGIMSVLNKYNNLQHIIYSILIGRIVIVIGSIHYDTQVIQLVTALSLFLPKHRRKPHAVIEWSSKPLRLTDLTRVKIAGFCRSDKRSETILKKYCSIIDVEKNIIIAPNYEGVYINSLIAKKKNFKSDEDFITFVHCWLMEIASKAFIYYHSYCLSVAEKSNCSSISTKKHQYSTSVKSFLLKIGVTGCDCHIVEYLTEVIKLLQLENNTQFKENGNKVSPVMLSYKQCELFQC